MTKNNYTEKTIKIGTFFSGIGAPHYVELDIISFMSSFLFM